MTTITVLGVGPGDPDLLTLKAKEAISQADVVAGFETVLKPVSRWIQGEAMPMRYRDQEEVLDVVAARAADGEKCVVCVWGDLNFSARELVERVQRRADETVLIPGISSVQVACTRLGLYMEESIFITLHARAGTDESLAELVEVLIKGKRNAIVLPRPYDIMPADIANLLLEKGIQAQTPLHTLQRLSFTDESGQDYTLGALAQEEAEFSDLTIMVFPKAR
ncbi:MAG: precorrin-6y C5,15-methyltransferase (decarboxylating) subunit CbiE [Chloroflexi bacterium]|nr:precorrin-6y C5,15-methyltransferase (decarboxylating) subunit CbiE [Chloroflexota bacterium]